MGAQVAIEALRVNTELLRFSVALAPICYMLINNQHVLLNRFFSRIHKLEEKAKNVETLKTAADSIKLSKTFLTRKIRMEREMSEAMKVLRETKSKVANDIQKLMIATKIAVYPILALLIIDAFLRLDYIVKVPDSAMLWPLNYIFGHSIGVWSYLYMSHFVLS